MPTGALTQRSTVLLSGSIRFSCGRDFEFTRSICVLSVRIRFDKGRWSHKGARQPNIILFISPYGQKIPIFTDPRCYSETRYVRLDGLEPLAEVPEAGIDSQMLGRHEAQVFKTRSRPAQRVEACTALNTFAQATKHRWRPKIESSQNSHPLKITSTRENASNGHSQGALLVVEVLHLPHPQLLGGLGLSDGLEHLRR
jgi:hypothetical protein